MKTKSVCAGIIGGAIIVAGMIVTFSPAFAQTSAAQGQGIVFPIAELGNCTDKDSCKKYCDQPANSDACFAFAQKNNLMSQGEIDTAKKFAGGEIKGPGGCTTKDSCENYCNDISHIDECVAFAKKSGIMSPDELAEAEKVQSAIARGVQPPSCKNKKECDVYCEAPANMEKCVAFGEAAGFLSGKELEDAKKMVTAIKSGVTPLPCKGKESCNAYCQSPQNMEACITFASAAGFMSPQEQQDSQKMLSAIRKGVKPPNCNGKEACDAYCVQPEHVDECTNFAVAAGFMSEKDAEMSKKTGGKGPGGCVGKDQCESFCKNPDNQQTCFNFAKDNGLISPDDLKKMDEGKQQMQQSFQNMPEEVANCLKDAVGSDAFEKMKTGQFMPSQDIGDKMGQCFSKMGPPQGQQGPQGQGNGPMGMPTSMPQEVRDCVKNAIGADEFDKMQSGSPVADFEKAKNCFQASGNNRPGQQPMPPQNMMPQSEEGQMQFAPGAGPNDFQNRPGPNGPQNIPGPNELQNMPGLNGPQGMPGQMMSPDNMQGNIQPGTNIPQMPYQGMQPYQGTNSPMPPTGGQFPMMLQEGQTPGVMPLGQGQYAPGTGPGMTPREGGQITPGQMPVGQPMMSPIPGGQPTDLIPSYQPPAGSIPQMQMVPPPEQSTQPSTPPSSPTSFRYKNLFANTLKLFLTAFGF